MISKFKISLKVESGSVQYNLGYQLYGALMERLPPNMCELLHRDGIAPLSQCFVYDRRAEEYCWQICAFDGILAESIRNVLQQQSTIRIESEGIHFSIQDIATERIASARELMLQAKEAFENASLIQVKFVTPTSFKQNGQYVLYPTVQMMVGNLVHKWNALNSDMVIEDEYAVNQIMEGLSIHSYKLQSANFTMKGIRVSGFVGEVLLKPRLSEPLLEIAKLLFYFANYSGIGIKSTLGMGGASTAAIKARVRTGSEHNK